MVMPYWGTAGGGLGGWGAGSWGQMPVTSGAGGVAQGGPLGDLAGSIASRFTAGMPRYTDQQLRDMGYDTTVQPHGVGQGGLLGSVAGASGSGTSGAAGWTPQGSFPRFGFGQNGAGQNPYMPGAYAQQAQPQQPTQGQTGGNDFLTNLAASLNARPNVPQDASPQWNQSTPAQGSLPWQTYKFGNPANSVQTNFNSLMQQNPTLAYKYLTSAGGGNEINNLFGQYGQSPGTANYVANAFMQPTMVGDSGAPGGGSAYDYLGLKPGDIPMDGQVSGNTFSAGGMSGNLAQSGAYEQKMGDPRAFLAANPYQNAPDIGSAQWWGGVQGNPQAAALPRSSTSQPVPHYQQQEGVVSDPRIYDPNDPNYLWAKPLNEVGATKVGGILGS